MEQINCESEIKKRYFKNRKVVAILTKIISKTKDENITSISNLCAYTPDKLKFSGLNLLDCIRKGKEFSYFDCNDSAKIALVIEKNRCKITIDYNGKEWASIWSMFYTYPIKIRISGPEENVKQECETLSYLL